MHGTTIIRRLRTSIKEKRRIAVSLADKLEFISVRATVFRQGIISLVLASLGSLVGGIILGTFSDVLELFPGLMIMVPAAIGMRGNIFASLGSRLSTSLHMGEISRLSRSPVITGNISASLFLTIIVSFFLGALSRATAHVFGFASISFVDLVVVSVLGGLISSLLILLFTLLVAVQSFLRGWDPDNVTAPLITSVGDLITLPCLFIAIRFLEVKYVVFAVIVIVCVISGILMARRKSPLPTRIVKDSLGILVISACLSTGSGIVINSRIDQFLIMSGLLTLVPPFLEGGGALGGILSSRLSTALHLGMIESTWKPPSDAVEDFSVIALLGITLFPAIGVLAFGASAILGLDFPPLYLVVQACLYAGLLIAVVVCFLSYYAAVASTRFGLDPDSVVIPMISGFMDFLGTNCLLFALIALGIA
ncbi:MAG: magnesium transporter [Theionarchaea archaeon]|nr:magnesium transporter [Theionarchaea archaeon]MBU7036715.1 magnesium transporter [Theionarchaea archaeon]